MSAGNSLKHGVYAKDLAIPRGAFAEGPDRHEALVASINAAIRPRNGIEQALTDQLITYLLRGERLNEFEREGIAGMSPTRRTVSNMATDPLIDDVDDYRREQSVPEIIAFLNNVMRLNTTLGKQIKQTLDLIADLRGDNGLSLYDVATPDGGDDGPTKSNDIDVGEEPARPSDGARRDSDDDSSTSRYESPHDGETELDQSTPDDPTPERACPDAPTEGSSQGKDAPAEVPAQLNLGVWDDDGSLAPNDDEPGVASPGVGNGAERETNPISPSLLPPEQTSGTHPEESDPITDTDSDTSLRPDPDPNNGR